MQYFTIRDIENLTGIKAHTFRIWEQRYELFTPKRKESQHRIYDNEDLKLLLRIAFLYHSGYKISRIAELSHKQILHAVNEMVLDEKNQVNAVLRLTEAVLDFDQVYFTDTLNKIIKQMGFENAIRNVCYPFLQRIGLLWMTNNIIPAQEHFSSYIIQNQIIAEIEKLESPTRDQVIVLFCPEGEHHELPLLFLNYLFKKNGWKTIYLGSNIHISTLQILSDNADYFLLHQITNFSGFTADDYLERLCRTFSKKKIIASGSIAFESQRSFVNLRLLKSDEEIYKFIEKAV